jgi:primosomal protein N'
MGHFENLARLLQLEAEEESKRLADEATRSSGAAAERSGRCLLKLVIRDEQPAMGGRVIATLAKRDQTQTLPWNRLGVGTPVLLTEENVERQRGWRGVVCRRGAAAIDVVLTESPELQQDRPTFRLDISSDEIARQRQTAALSQARTAEKGRLAHLRDVLLNQRSPKQNEQRPLTPLDEGLNASQIEAVEFALAAADVAIVHGPPGTGKTTTVVELIRQAVARGEKVLACAPSNLAVDNLLERLQPRPPLAQGVVHGSRLVFTDLELFAREPSTSAIV